MKTIQCFRLETISGAEGEFLSLTARFTTKEEADKAAPACGGYGGRVSPETITIYDLAYEWDPKLNIGAAATGLAKLTLEERLALGLS